MQVLRIYHGGRNPRHRERDRALSAAGIDLTLVVPRFWPEPGHDASIANEPFPVVEVEAQRPGDVNRWSLRDPSQLAQLLHAHRPDVLDVHAEPFSTVMHQILELAPPNLPIVGYTAQNIDKRFPPPFAQRERAALQRLAGLYPCTRQAASVAVGKGYDGVVRVLPLGVSAVAPDRPRTGELQLALIGRLVPEKGVQDAVRLLAAVHKSRPARLILAGDGPEATAALSLAHELGVGDRLELRPWQDEASLTALYASTSFVLVPSLRTPRWVEQFGRVAAEAQAAGAVVAAYATGSLPEVIGTAGIVVGEGDWPGMAAALLSADAGGLRQAGLQRSRAFTWTAVAAGQGELYREARATPTRPRRRPQPRQDRERARATYGPPADVPGGGRPYAMPVLRSNRSWAQRLARLQDAVTFPA